jgi:surface carbohydrate biosynthesis protein
LVELSDREIPSRLVLAAKLRQAGFRVVLAQQWAIMQSLPTLPRGILFYKGYNRIFRESMKVAKRLGFLVVAQEEEVFGRTEEEIFQQYVGPDLSECLDLIFCNNEFEFTFLKTFVDHNKLFLSGNPRSDLMFGSAGRVLDGKRRLIRQEFGSYILVNTNFGWTNSIWGSFEQVKSAMRQAGGESCAAIHGDSYYSDIALFEETNYKLLTDLIDQVHKDVRVVVRPHPGERLDKWSKLTKPYGRAVRVVRSGSHLPWTLEAGLVVHTSCTTGLEAAALGIPQVSTWVRGDNLYQRQLSEGIIGNSAATAEELVSHWLSVRSGSAADHDTKDLKARFSVADGAEVSDRIVDKLRSLPPSVHLEVFAPLPKKWPKAVPQLPAKCNVYLSDIDLCLSSLGIGSSLLPHRVERSVFEFCGASAAPVSAESLVGESEEKFARSDFWGVIELFSRYSHLFMRSEAGLLLACRSFLELSMWKECVQASDQFMSISRAMPKEIALAKATALWRLGDRKKSKELFACIYSKCDSITAYFSLRRAGVHGKSFTVLGDSHARYFRYLQINRDSYFRCPVLFEIFECGGATAYGLSNDISRSGARRVFGSKEFLTSAARTDYLILWFGEVDCRRAIWRAVEDSGISVGEALADAVNNIRRLIGEAVGQGFNVAALGVKPPIIGDEDFRVCCDVDDRCVFKTFEERALITSQFNAALDRACRDSGAAYVPLPDEGCDGSLGRWFVRDDTHGDVTYFSERIIKAFILADMLEQSDVA